MDLREFEDWALAQGSVGNPTKEESYKGQCVSLVQQYLSKVHGIPFKARGNAKDWSNITIEGFKKLSANNSLKPGDILVYNRGTYGHVVIVNADNKALEQNKNGNKKITVGNIDKGYIAIHRPNKIDLGNSTVTYKVGQVYTTQVALKVRKGAGTDKEQKKRTDLTADGQKHAYNYNSAVLKSGTRVTALETKKLGSNIWLRIPSGWIAGFYDNKKYVK